MTVENAVSIAGGFTPRAAKGSVTITRKIQGVPQRFPAAAALQHPARRRRHRRRTLVLIRQDLS
jgi:protein involved in polysaccharide export with SLBB domain